MKAKLLASALFQYCAFSKFVFTTFDDIEFSNKLTFTIRLFFELSSSPTQYQNYILFFHKSLLVLMNEAN